MLKGTIAINLTIVRSGESTSASRYSTMFTLSSFSIYEVCRLSTDVTSSLTRTRSPVGWTARFLAKFAFSRANPIRGRTTMIALTAFSNRPLAAPIFPAPVILFESKLYRSLLYESCMDGPGRYRSTLCVSTRFCANIGDFERSIQCFLRALQLNEQFLTSSVCYQCI